MAELGAPGAAGIETADGARRARLLAAGRLDAGFGDGAQVADEVPGRAVRLAPRPGGREFSQPREAEQALGHLRLGGEEPLPAQADALDQAAHEDVGAAFLHRRRRFSVELEEGLDSLPSLGRDLGALEGRVAGGDHVDLPPPGNRRQPRQVGRAQLDRRPGQRPRGGSRVSWVGEHPQPGDRVTDLGTLEQRRRTGEVKGDPPLLHRRRDCARRRLPGRQAARRSPRAACRRRAGALPRGPLPGPGHARSCSASVEPLAREIPLQGRGRSAAGPVAGEGVLRAGTDRPRPPLTHATRRRASSA